MNDTHTYRNRIDIINFVLNNDYDLITKNYKKRKKRNTVTKDNQNLRVPGRSYPSGIIRNY